MEYYNPCIRILQQKIYVLPEIIPNTVLGGGANVDKRVTEVYNQYKYVHRNDFRDKICGKWEGIYEEKMAGAHVGHDGFCGRIFTVDA